MCFRWWQETWAEHKGFALMSHLNVSPSCSQQPSWENSEMSQYCTWFRDRLLWATLWADRSPWAQPGVALSNKDEGCQTGAKKKGEKSNSVKFSELECPMMYSIYLGNFNAPILFLRLVSDGIVVPCAVVIHQLPVALCYTCLNTRWESICCED